MKRVLVAFAFMALLACSQGRTLLQNGDSNGAGQSSSSEGGISSLAVGQGQSSSPPPPPDSPSPPTPPSPSEPLETTDTQTITTPASTSEDSGDGDDASLQLGDDESEVVEDLPSDIVSDGTSVDTSVAADVENSLQENEDDPDGGADALDSALSSANVVTVSKGFSRAVASNPSSASALSESFAQLCIRAAKSGDVTFVKKSVSSFSLSLVFLVINGNTSLARTCASSFTSFIVSSGGCSEFVVVIIQTFIHITVNLTTKTSVTIFG